jgi:PhnB protein
MMMRYGESPEPPPPSGMPEGWAAKVMHVTLRVGGAVLMASDGNQADPRFLGFCLSLSLPSQAETERAFAALANGGQVHMPLAKTFWSPCFGMVQDRFGVGWMVSVAATVG